MKYWHVLAILLALVAAGLVLIGVAVWTGDARWAQTGILLGVPAVIGLMIFPAAIVGNNFDDYL